MLPTLPSLADFLAGRLQTHRFPPGDPAGIWSLSAADGPIARLGLALEPWPGLAAWAATERLDALWLHRPWKLAEHPAPAGLGVLAHHLAFDERLTIGFNPLLGAALGLTGPEPFGEKDGRPLGMIGRGERLGFADLARRVEEVFGGLDLAVPPRVPEPMPPNVAVVGAMTEALVRDAVARGAGVYLTGQWRRPAEAAARETGLGVLTVGHARAERWGLRTLAGLLRERWAVLEVMLAPET